MSSVEWETPQDLFDALDAEFQFTMDAAATGENKKCPYYFSRENNGVVCPWSGIVWLNPPYDRTMNKWIQKAYEEAQRGILVVCLLPSRYSGAKAWHKYIMRATELRFVSDRLRFFLDGQSERSPSPSVIVVFKPYCQGPPLISSINTKGEPLL